MRRGNLNAEITCLRAALTAVLTDREQVARSNRDADKAPPVLPETLPELVAAERVRRAT